jgi:hypothetical protein
VTDAAYSRHQGEKYCAQEPSGALRQAKASPLLAYSSAFSSLWLEGLAVSGAVLGRATTPRLFKPKMTRAPVSARNRFMKRVRCCSTFHQYVKNYRRYGDFHKPNSFDEEKHRVDRTEVVALPRPDLFLKNL